MSEPEWSDAFLEETRLGVRKIDATGDGLKMEFEVAQKFMCMLASGMDAMLDHAQATNYVEMQFRDNVRPETVTLTVQRFGKLTPHQKCVAAEAALSSLRLAVRELTAERDGLLGCAAKIQRAAWLAAKRESCPSFTQLGTCHTCEAQALARYPDLTADTHEPLSVPPASDTGEVR